MTLTMWADQLSLHRGQSTTYHVKLDGLQGLPASAWGSSFFPSDLVSPSELSSGSPSNSQSGSITLSVTNMSPATIAMQNTFTTLDAKLFQPSGSYQFDGGVTAIADGGFNINGVARAYLQPELGLGYPQGSTPPATSAFNDSIWNPSFHLSYNPASATAKYTFPDCSAAGTDQACTPRPDYSAVFNAGDNAIAPVGSATPSAAERAAAYNGGVRTAEDKDLPAANSLRNRDAAEHFLTLLCGFWHGRSLHTSPGLEKSFLHPAQLRVSNALCAKICCCFTGHSRIYNKSGRFWPHWIWRELCLSHRA